jgi:sortase (surface protein transpeptidase)
VRLHGGRVVRVRPTSTQPDRSLAIPDDLRTAGWWRGGARVGDLYGSMLVAAHVDSTERGLGPFVALLYVARGARITVTSAHLTQVFAVTARRILSRDALPRAAWVSSFSGPHRLTLVTCAPPYVKARGGYQNLAVVVATPVGAPTKR